MGDWNDYGTNSVLAMLGQMHDLLSRILCELGGLGGQKSVDEERTVGRELCDDCIIYTIVHSTGMGTMGTARVTAKARPVIGAPKLTRFRTGRVISGTGFKYSIARDPHA